MFDELLNGSSKVISKSSAVSAADAPYQPFLYGPLKEEVYVNQLDDFVDPYHPDKVYPTQKGIIWTQTSSKGMIHQSPRGIFINQAKYAQEILKKHGMTSCDSIGTPMATKHLDADLSGTPVEQTKYRSKVGALMYLTASRPDIMHATCYCACYQAQPTEKHLTAVKQIFRYLKDTIHMGLWYPKDTDFKLTAFLDLDHAGCLDSRKSTSGGIQFLGGDKLSGEAVASVGGGVGEIEVVDTSDVDSGNGGSESRSHGDSSYQHTYDMQEVS
nr:ribonuclease H-like domain-containing protein [Tanacetum cinerariifolium]